MRSFVIIVVPLCRFSGRDVDNNLMWEADSVCRQVVAQSQNRSYSMPRIRIACLTIVIDHPELSLQLYFLGQI